MGGKWERGRSILIRNMGKVRHEEGAAELRKVQDWREREKERGKEKGRERKEEIQGRNKIMRNEEN